MYTTVRLHSWPHTRKKSTTNYLDFGSKNYSLRLGSNFNVTYVEVRMARYVKFICYINYSAISKRQIGLSSFDNIVKMHLAG